MLLGGRNATCPGIELKLFVIRTYKFAENLYGFVSSPLLVAIMELHCGNIYEKCCNYVYLCDKCLNEDFFRVVPRNRET